MDLSYLNASYLHIVVPLQEKREEKLTLSEYFKPISKVLLPESVRIWNEVNFFQQVYCN